MGLNDIILTPRIVADLFPDVLLESITTVVPQKTPLRYLGNNEKNILVVTRNDDAVFLPDKELQFLTSVLTACKLGLADVAIINWSHMAGISLQEIFDSVKVSKILLFDVTPGTLGLPINFPEFQVQGFDQRSYLHAPSLSGIENDPALKKQLWTALKKLFALQ